MYVILTFFCELFFSIVTFYLRSCEQQKKSIRREIHEDGYNQSAFYLNVDRILKPLTKVKLVTKDYRGIPTEFAEETIINSWDDLK